MTYNNEIVNMVGEMPVKLFVENIEKMKYGFSTNISLIFVIKGEVIIKKEDNKYTLEEEDIVLINPNTMYTINSLNTNQVYILEIDGQYFNSYYSNFNKLTFNLNSLEMRDYSLEDYVYVKKIMIKLLEVCIKKDNGYLLIAKQLSTQLMITLINKFTSDSRKQVLATYDYDEKIDNIVKFVLIHYKEKISLQDISDQLYLNPQYISRYFSKQMGITLNNFISNIRLQESINDLSNSDKKITFVALDNGFPNLKSYFKAFKEVYNMTPSKYRSLYLKELNANLIELDFDRYNLNKIQRENDEIKILPRETKDYIIHYNSEGKSLNKSWKRLLAFGRASEGMREELRNQLRLVQKEIGFEYVRFHGIISDEMMVYSEDLQGNPEYNFTYVDELIDFLLKIKLKPFIELGYMPESLASEKKYIFAWKANISYPKSIKKWDKLIKVLVKHLIERYGIGEVRNWYFQICDQWSFFNTDEQKYFEFFEETYSSVKCVDASLRIGGTFDEQLLEKFFIFNKSKNISLDFIGFRTYALKPEGKTTSIEIINKVGKISENQLILQNSIDYCIYADENFIEKTIDRILKKAFEHKSNVKEFFITEWNTTPSQKDLLHDTCFKASFFVRNVLNNFDKLDGMAYWSFSDIFEETKASNQVFHGGLGFIGNNSIKKPIYYAYQFMNRLEEVILRKEEDFIVTKSKDGAIQILAFNYCHFNESSKRCHSKDITLKERYHVFDERGKKLRFVIKGIFGDVVERVYKLNRENGSAFDQWLGIGAPENICYDEINYIKNKSIYGYTIKNINVNGDLIINETMEPHEVFLIEILPVKNS